MQRLSKSQLAMTSTVSEPSRGKWWQTSEYEIHKCKYTDNHLYINTSQTRFLIVPHIDKNAVSKCAKEASYGLKCKFDSNPYNYPSNKRKSILSILDELEGIPELYNIGKVIDFIGDSIFGENSHGSEGEKFFNNIAIYVLFHLRHHNVIALFNSELLMSNKLNIIELPWPCSGSGVIVIRKIFKFNSATKSQRGYKYLCVYTNSISALDCDEGLFEKLFSEEIRKNIGNTYGTLVAALARCIHSIDPKQKIDPQDYHGKIRSSEDVFSGIECDGSTDQWVALGRHYYEFDKSSNPSKRKAVREFIKYIIENKNITRIPQQYFDKQFPIQPLYNSDIQDGTRGVYHFLQWVFEKLCCISDDNGDMVCLNAKRWVNPLDKPYNSRVSFGKTSREVVPANVIMTCKEVILANDFEWPKKIGGDWFNNASEEYIWSPIRAIAILMKLSIPLRNKQMLTLSTGEGDTWRYEADCCYDLASGPASGSFVLNTGPHAPISSKILIQEGMFRRFPKRAGGYACHIFANNNKTADRHKDLSNHGYVMPWENMEAIGYALYLRDWQERENQSPTRVCWNDVEWLRKDKDFRLLKKKHDFFLFRDPANQVNPNRSHPLSNGKLMNFWCILLEEVERRLNILEGTTENTNPNKFILNRDIRNRPCRVKWDLHSLRVTIISYLHDAGVPLEYLREIAGHQSLQMTSYYSVINPEKMAAVLDEAIAKWKGMSAVEWGSYLKGVAREKVRDLIVAKDDAILEQVFQGDRDGLMVMDHGLCLVGETMCQVGLEALGENNERIYVPVPGGKSNCVRCRYFATGPAWLPGLAAHFNWLTLRLTKESRLLSPVQEEYERLRSEFLECVREEKPFGGRRKWDRTIAAYDSAFSKTNEIGHSFQATYKLWEQARELARREAQGNTEGLNLIVQGGIETMVFALERCHPTDTLARICETANLYPAVSQPNEANQDLCCNLDKMLFNNGIPGLLVTLGEEEKRVTALEIWKWLKQRTRTNEEYADVVDCRSTLEALGFRFEFLEMLRTMQPFLANLPNEKEIQQPESPFPPRIKGRWEKSLSMRKRNDEKS